MNAKMADLRRVFEAAGFTDVTTILSSGNVVFSARAASESGLQRKAEAAMLRRFGAAFLTLVRPVEALRDMLASDPYRAFRLDPSAKRIVTFLRDKPKSKIALPVELEGARILALKGREAFSAYVRSLHGPVFMTLIERTFGREQTTRTWDTVAKVVRA